MTNMYPAHWLFGILFCLSATGGVAQTYIMSNTPINTCNGFFYDPGGPNGDYGPNLNLTTTICPQGLGGTHVQMIFSAPQLGAGDQLCFYDGPNTSAPLLSCSADFEPGQPFVIQATAVNPGGCLTITFTSDGAGQGAGWSADINCIAACQIIRANLVSSTPAVEPIDTGWIDVCPGQRIFFNGNGSYPQNGAVYNHSDLTSSFSWNFGNGGSAVGPNVSYAYDEPGGYIVQLTITDQFGCKNTNFLTQRVRVSTQPDFRLAGDLSPTICAGDTININAVVDTLDVNYVFSVTPTEGSFPSGGIRSDSLPLPDGTGVAFSTSIAFNTFSPGQALTNINDLLGICVNMEHSWLHDLEIRITCPSGQTAILHNFISPPTTGGAGETRLGIPFDPDPPTHPNAINTPWGVIVPGIGWDYCWTPTATRGTWRQYATANNPGTMPTGDYNSFQPLTNLLGCPLNGEWTLTVEDRWGADNGFIFNWSINFAAHLYPNLETFRPQIVDYGWGFNPSIIQQTPNAITAVPFNAGTASYTFFVTDNFGCTYDTAVNIMVLPFTHPDCYSCSNNIATLADAQICDNESVTLNAGAGVVTDTEVTFEAVPYAPFGFSNHPPANPFNSTIVVNSINPGILTNPNQQIVSVCIDIETDWCADLRIFLRAPNGVLLELSTNNGGSGDNYTNTCFSPAATVFIQTGTPPFTGFFRPEGMWTTLTGTPINGNWTLVASDAFGINDMGRINSWSITFRNVNNVTYTWSPSAGLSCTNCPSPVAMPTSTTTYTVQSSDSYNCTYSASVTVDVLNNIPAPAIVCGSQGNGQLTFSWGQVATYTEYEIREIINGNAGPWQGPFTGLSHTVSNLVNGDEVTVEVRVYFPPGATNCQIAQGSADCLYETCTLSAALSGSTQDVSCNGLNDGVATITASGGVAPINFYLDGSATPAPSGAFTTLGAGAHTVVVEDAVQCQIVINFTINEPPPIQVNIIQTQAVSCHQGTNGALTATASGGNGGYQYAWNGGAASPSPVLPGLGAGAYTVVARDARGCEAVSTISIPEPGPVSVQLTVNPITCNGIANGAIGALGAGGVGGFSYTWSHVGSGQAQQSALSAGNYCVTATDANGCAISDCVVLTEPAPLVVDSLTFQPVSCNGGSNGSASAFVSGGTGPYNYVWSDTPQQFGQTAVFLSAGDFTVTVTDQNGCTLIDNVTISQPEALSANFNITNPLCSGQSTGALSALISGGVGAYTYSWENGQASPSLSNIPAGNYRLTVTDGNGCQLQTQAALVSPDPLSLDLSQTSRGCFGLAGNEAGASATGGVGPYTYTWSNGAQGAAVAGLAQGAYTATVTDANGCTLSGNVALVDWDAVQINIISNPPTCNGVADGALGVNIILGGAGGAASEYSFQWSNNATGAAIQNLPGGLNYRLTVTDRAGCIGIAEKFLDQPAPITFDLSRTNALCFGSADGTATVSNINGDNVTFSVQWDANAANQTGLTAANLIAGRYGVTVMDNDGCTASGEIDVAQPTEVVLNVVTTHNGCFGNEEGTARLTASGGTPGYTYAWPGNRSGNEITGLVAGAYMATVTDAQGCEKTIEAVITQPEPLMAEVAAKDVTCFGGRNGSIAINITGGTPAFQYSLDNRNFNGASVMVGLRAGTYVIYIKDAKGCTQIAEATIIEPDEFSIDAGPLSHTVAQGDSLVLTATAINAQGDVEFVWSAAYGNTLTCTECAVTVAYPTDQITYEVYGIDSKGCEATQLITVFVTKERIAVVPSAFTPNGDGMNDRLLVHGREGTRVLSFRIFDRWGQMLYQGGDYGVNDPVYGWDGEFRAAPAPSGVYIWQLEVEYPDGVKETKNGHTTLIR
jgi:gliding motility-associated-like protein